MSRKKKNSYTYWESKGAVSLDSKGNPKNESFVRMCMSMIYSDAYVDLSDKQKNLYMCCKCQYKRTSPAKDFPTIKEFQSDDFFYLDFPTIKNLYKLYNSDGNKGQFYKDMKALESHGFIKKVLQGRYNQKNVYQYSTDWKTWTNKNDR